MTRTCSIPGCHAPHRARGWCAKHYMRWHDHGSPIALRRYQPPVSPEQTKEMLSLAAEGLSRSDIAACTGWSVQTVGRHVGHIVPARHLDQQPDLTRYRRMIEAVAETGAEYVRRDAIAGRFGLKNAKVLGVVLVTARRRVAEAERGQ